MQYTIEWQDQAIENLLSIRKYLEENASEEVADKILGDIFDHAEDLVNFPYRYVVYPDRPAVRRMVVGEYNVFYRVIEEKGLIRVYNVFRSSMDTKRHMGPTN